VKRIRLGKYSLAALAALVTFLVYLPALRNAFVYWDDNLYVFENPNIRSLDASFFNWAFFGFHVSNWHPLTWISHAVDYAIWGLDPLGHHLTNNILHAINTALVVLLAVKLLGIAKQYSAQKGNASFLNDRTILIAAGVTGLLFGIHPVHVESVAWVSERKDLLCALFFLLSIIWYANYVSYKTYKTYMLTLCFFILALMSKPMAVTLPLVLLILDWYPLGKIRSYNSWWAATIEKIPFFALSVCSSITTLVAQKAGGSIASMEAAPFAVRLLVAVKSVVGYLWNMLLPLHLIPLHPYPKKLSLLSLEYIIPIIFVVLITLLCLMAVKQQKGWLSAWGYYLITLIPVLGVVQAGSQAMADRYTYLPSLGPFLVAALLATWSLEKARTTFKSGGTLISAGVIILLGSMLSIGTIKQIDVWRDSITLWSQELEQEPDIRHAYVNRGIAFMDTGRLEQALADFNRAISMNATDHLALYNRGLLFAKLNLVAQAISDYNAALLAKPSYYEVYNNRGILYERLGRFNEAMADYNEAIALNPAYHKAYINRAVMFDRAGQVDRALTDLTQAISLNPYDPDAYYNRGLMFHKIGQLDRALRDFDAAVSLSPNDPDAHYNRGILLNALGQYNRALADFDSVIALNPSYYQAYYNRGLVFQKTGQVDKANRDFQLWKEQSARQ
jgi:tetratricopeptide (TPR) repeat protein